MVLLPQPAGPVTMMMWCWLVIDMAAGLVSSREVDETDGDAVFDIGGVSGVVYGTGADCSKVCNMIAVQ